MARTKQTARKTGTTVPSLDAQLAARGAERIDDTDLAEYPQARIPHPEGAAVMGMAESDEHAETAPAKWECEAMDNGRGDARFDAAEAAREVGKTAVEGAAGPVENAPPVTVPAPEVKELTWRVVDELWSPEDYKWTMVRMPKTAVNDGRKYLFVVHRRVCVSNTIKVMVRVLSPPLAKTLQKIVAPHERLYEPVPFMPCNHLFASRAALREWVDRPANADEETEGEALTKVEEMQRLTPDQVAEARRGVRMLLEFMDEEMSETLATYNALVQDDLITYEFLWHMFAAGDQVVFPHSDIGGALQAMTVTSAKYVESQREEPAYFALIGKTIEWDGTRFFTHEVRRGITQFTGPRRIADLSVQPLHRLTRETQQQLVARGTRYTQLAGIRYINYTGALIIRTGQRVFQVPCRGRAMVDRQGFHEENPSAQLNAANTWNQQQNGLDLLTANDFDPAKWTDLDYLRMPPVVYGFSLAKKAWGEMLVDEVVEIEFDPHVYDQLVLPSDTKELVKGLVESHEAGGLVGDVIEGKGQGLIFLLHGNPGCGKTLTAEAIAEQLQRPLYAIGVGELGTIPGQLEQSLQRALDLAEAWNAVLLLDEADVFLEQRSSQDLIRNGMVACFLRALERYSGILFLTTNRVAEFDAAFGSRITLALRYADLDTNGRAKIWTQVLDRIHNGQRSAWASRIDLPPLAAVPLNGRRIKSVLRTAQAMATREGRDLEMTHIRKVLRLVSEFKERPADQQNARIAVRERWMRVLDEDHVGARGTVAHRVAMWWDAAAVWAMNVVPWRQSAVVVVVPAAVAVAVVLGQSRIRNAVVELVR
ncbi:hypothetical protein GGF32_009902 [Allomyces javanicus]|nr:hypothetical protein GGF32_009902 [Allomyces javanicus]